MRAGVAQRDLAREVLAHELGVPAPQREVAAEVGERPARCRASQPRARSERAPAPRASGQRQQQQQRIQLHVRRRARARARPAPAGVARRAARTSERSRIHRLTWPWRKRAEDRVVEDEQRADQHAAVHARARARARARSAAAGSTRASDQAELRALVEVEDALPDVVARGAPAERARTSGSTAGERAGHRLRGERRVEVDQPDLVGILPGQQRAAGVLVAVVVEAPLGVLAGQHQEVERDEQRHRDLEPARAAPCGARRRHSRQRGEEQQRAAGQAEQLEGQAAQAVGHADEGRSPLRERERRQRRDDRERRVEDRRHARSGIPDPPRARCRSRGGGCNAIAAR